MVKLKNRSEIIMKIRVVGFCFIGIFLVIIARGYNLQMLKSPELAKRIKSQHKSTIELTPARGTIYDRNGMELAVSMEVESLYARPHLVENKKAAAKKLSRVVDLSYIKVLKKLTSDKKFVWIKRQMEHAQTEKIKPWKIPGLSFVKESKRYYPNNELAGQLLGFVGTDAQGLEGLEFQYNDVLRGTSRFLVVDKDGLGRHLFLENVDTADYLQGHDLYLTIDKNIQYMVEKELQAAVKRSRAKAGTAIALDPSTGEVLALATVPLFNPNRFSSSNSDIWRNRAVIDMYEPGSTFKTFLIASALEEGLVKPHDIFFCENGSYRVANKTIHDVHPYGWLSVSKILKHSSNIGASKISKHLGKTLFYRYIRKFGFGEETGIEFPTEAIGSVPLPYRCSDHTLRTISFGHGISVTALQMVTAYAAIANDGLLVKPTFIKTITNPRGEPVYTHDTFVRHRVVSEKTACTVKEMLKSVIRKNGTGTRGAIPGYTVAGKTGTSEKVDSGAEGYSRKKTIASFAGFVPADNPRITILVTIDEPTGMTSGGQTAAPGFSGMARHILNFMDVPPKTPITTEQHTWKETKRMIPGTRTRG